jgi:hypothetical protein
LKKTATATGSTVTQAVIKTIEKLPQKQKLAASIKILNFSF